MRKLLTFKIYFRKEASTGQIIKECDKLETYFLTFAFSTVELV